MPSRGRETRWRAMQEGQPRDGIEPYAVRKVEA